MILASNSRMADYRRGGKRAEDPGTVWICCLRGINGVKNQTMPQTPGDEAPAAPHIVEKQCSTSHQE
ncbi:hypothetical protein LU631_16470 [Erwinia tracheiphila]|nr:hypothetical protein [Erwinia tracheiphila]UIA86537.1 hypothetical protein LU631_16470 [Erwinia tracheiphila]UIA94890.1 hypothetical protein LU633_14930 [Erwinia tracheiphila]